MHKYGGSAGSPSSLRCAPVLEIGAQELEWLALGAAIFGAGGGGDPRLGHHMASQAIAHSGPVQLLDLDELEDDQLILPICMMGATTVMVEKFGSGTEALRLQEAVENEAGTQVAAICCLELGGLNGVVPFAWAARAGLPVVDADLMGRAFPELQMTTAHLAGVSATPAVMTDERGNVVTLSTTTAVWAEDIARSVCTTMGAEATICLYPMTVGTARGATVRNSITSAMAAGRVMLEVADDPVRAMCDHLNGYPLIEGKVVDVDRQTTEGFARGSAIVEGIGACGGRVARLEFQNENTVLIEDGRVRASVPDIITAVDLHTARPIVTELLRYGQLVSIVGLPIDSLWRTAEGLAVAGPRAFGYDFDYRPVEDLNAG